MSARTLTARFAGECRGCDTMIEPGDLIVNLGRGRNYHVNCRTRGNPSYEVRLSSGFVGYVNRNGRCEDAPCCGCCTM